MFREALMLHYLDDLDSKMAAVRSALDSDKGEGNWTAYNGALERRILRVDLFRRDESEAAQTPADLGASRPVQSRQAGRDRAWNARRILGQ